MTHWSYWILYVLLPTMGAAIGAHWGARRLTHLKAALDASLEKIRTTLGSQLYIHQVRYEKEYDLLSRLCAEMVEFRDATVFLRPEVDLGPDPQELEEKRRRLRRYNRALRDLYDVFEKQKPFYPEEIYDALVESVGLAHREAVDYRMSTQSKAQTNDYWEKAGKRRDQIAAGIENIVVVIRDRIKRWEHLDFDELRLEPPEKTGRASATTFPQPRGVRGFLSRRFRR
jgi:hypothetical protein